MSITVRNFEVNFKVFHPPRPEVGTLAGIILIFFVDDSMKIDYRKKYLIIYNKRELC